MKNIFKVYILVIAFFALGSNLCASNIINKSQCDNKGEEYIFAGGECIQYYISEGEVESEINIIVHGTWDAGNKIHLVDMLHLQIIYQWQRISLL